MSMPTSTVMRIERLLLAIAVTLFIAEGCRQRPEHGIELSTESVDLGIVYPDSAIKHVSITCKNTGRLNLVITGARPDCDCTTIDFSPVPIKTGEERQLPITIDLHNYFPGKFEKKVALYSNAAKKPLVIVIKGEARYKP